MAGVEVLKVAAIVFVGVSSLVVGDTAGKILTNQGVGATFVAFSRFALASVLILPFSGMTLSELPKLLNWRILVRAVLIAISIFCVVCAAKSEPIANVFGAFFIGPIVSYSLAVLFLREKTSVVRSVLLAIGFGGVMLVVKPGFGASIGMVYALTAGAAHGAYLVMTRMVAAEFRPRFLLISQLMLGTCLLAPFGLQVELPDLPASLIALIFVSALGSAFGNFLLAVASKSADASVIAPLVYSQLISAVFAGIFVFGDWPDAMSFAGLILIIASGLGSLFVSQRDQKNEPVKVYL